MANTGPPPVLPVLPIPPIRHRKDPEVSHQEFNLYDSSGSFNKDTQRNIARIVDDVLARYGKPAYSGLTPISDKAVLDHTNRPALWTEAIATQLSRTKAWELPKDVPYNGEPSKPYEDHLTPARLDVVRKLIPKSWETAQKYDSRGSIHVPRINGTHERLRGDTLTATDLFRALYGNHKRRRSSSAG